MRNWQKWADRLLTLAFGVCVLAVVWVLLQVTSFTSFRVPSPSMYPALVPGDYIHPLMGKDTLFPENGRNIPYFLPN